MCGIFCIYSECQNNVTEELSKTFQEFKFNISRRGPNCSKIEVCHLENDIFLFGSSVLWLQGLKLIKQPIHTEDYVFMFNGDIFDEETESQRRINGDTKLFIDLLVNQHLILNKLSSVNGPFAFVYLDKINCKLYFGRDKFGRRSLLIGKDGDQKLILSSVAKRNLGIDFLELPPLGVFSIDLKSKQISVFSWNFKSKNFEEKLVALKIFLKKNIDVVLDKQTIERKKFIAPQQKDEALFHTFDNDQNYFEKIIQTENWLKNVIILQTKLHSAIQKRISTQPKYCQTCVSERVQCTHCLTGVLFSGGVDCTVLAYIAHYYVDENRPIDLLNVAFSKDDNFETPDRKTGLESLKELKNLCPHRIWNFVEININENELNFERSHQIADLIYPLNSILDDSLGCALWFASRGRGSDGYISPCRILLVGMGADELFGGYTRHRSAMKENGWEGLHNVLDHDWENLPYRNLGRDDRVVSDHGRQLRTPYLDESLVKFVRGLECWQKSCPSNDLPQGIGDKILLRTLAHYLGLHGAAQLKKRALQFGSRIANSKENAHDVSPRL